MFYNYSEIPHELIREARGSEVHLNMEDHRHEEFTQVKQKLKPFSGTGHTLGSPAPATVGSPSKEEGDRTVNEEVAKEQVKIDQSQPTTNIQIRLADGSRLIGQFNHVHTVNDVRRYIVLYPFYMIARKSVCFLLVWVNILNL